MKVFFSSLAFLIPHLPSLILILLLLPWGEPWLQAGVSALRRKGQLNDTEVLNFVCVAGRGEGVVLNIILFLS